ncbi:MAG TPA: cyclic nucleotide-binding domain-containing protein [Spirochaetia bacterium]|nr:cyclic nucleotide-binding domain-containing protein [Spirochaetia bacterium]
MTSLESYVRRHSVDSLLTADLVRALHLVRRRAGELFIRSGDPATEILFLVEGRTKVYSTLENGQSVLAAFYRPFDVLGEVELFTFRRFTLSVEALTDSACLSLSADAIRKAAPRNCRLFMYLCSRLGAKLADRVIAESINLRYPVEKRLAGYLLAATDKDGWVLGTDNLGELADFIGASYRQLSRVVRAFRQQGILDRTRGRLRVAQKARLGPLVRDRYLANPYIPRSLRVASWSSRPMEIGEPFTLS